MRYTGIVRRLDNLGRVVLPAEMRRLMQVRDNDEVEMFMEDGRIIVRKYLPSCLFCGNNNNLVEYHEQMVCAECRATLGQME